MAKAQVSSSCASTALQTSSNYVPESADIKSAPMIFVGRLKVCVILCAVFGILASGVGHVPTLNSSRQELASTINLGH